MKFFRLLSLGFFIVLSSAGVGYYLSAKRTAPRITQEQFEDLSCLPCVILGGGCAGLTAANYLALAGHQPLVLHSTTPQEGGLIAQSHHVQNWPGETEITGAALIKKMQTQATLHGAILRNETIIRVDFKKYPFTITTQTPEGEEKSYRALTCLIMMGATPNYLGIPGEQEHWGKGVSNCALCDGPLYKGKKVAIVGGGDSAVTEALYLSNLAKEVHILVRKKQLKTSRAKLLAALTNVEIHYETEVTRVLGAQDVTGVETKTGTATEEMALDALFLAIGSKPNSALFKGQLNPALDSEGYVDQNSLPAGVFAAGDMCDKKYRQAVTAAGDACKAAIEADDFLKGLGLEFTRAPQKAPKKEVQKEVKAPVKAAAPVEIRTVSDLRALSSHGVPYVVDFYADWCGACVAMKPVLDKIEKELAGKMGFYKVNVDRAEALSAELSIRGIPAFIFFDENGNEIKRIVGSRPYKAFLDECKEVVK